MKNIIERRHLQRALTYQDYRDVTLKLVKEGRVTGTNQSDELTQYARLHCHRMQRIEKSVKLLPEVADIIKRIELPQTWLVLTESWCGDAAQIVPIINAFTMLTDQIDYRLLLRDENLELMDQYLTNGKARSIPKLVVAKSHNLEEIFHWGPRPAGLQSLMNEWVADAMPFEEMKEALHLWYAKDEGVSTQKEIASLLLKYF